MAKKVAAKSKKINKAKVTPKKVKVPNFQKNKWMIYGAVGAVVLFIVFFFSKVLNTII